MEKHSAVEATLTDWFYRSAGRGLTLGTSSKCLVTGGKRIHKLCRISPAPEPAASRPQSSCASVLGLAFKIMVYLTALRGLWGERRLSPFQSSENSGTKSSFWMPLISHAWWKFLIPKVSL